MRLKLPDGLSVCAECGQIRGSALFKENGEDEAYLMTSTCYCEGRECSRCHKRKLRRPTSQYYDPEARDWFNVPYFMGHQTVCADCHRPKK